MAEYSPTYKICSCFSSCPSSSSCSPCSFLLFFFLFLSIWFLFVFFLLLLLLLLLSLLFFFLLLLLQFSYRPQVCNAVIVIVYEDGREADVHVMPREMCEEYWQKWLQRLAEYNESDARHLRQVPVNAGSASAGSVIAGSALMQKNRTKHQMDAKTVNSIGVPVSSIGTVVRDKDVISERCSLLSRVLRDFLGSRILEWKLLKSIVSLLRRLFSRNVRKR